MNKKLIISLVMIGILAFGAGLGTYAWFTSTATSTGNTYQSGTLAIDVDGSLENDNKFELLSADNIAPGDVIGEKTIEIDNRGSLNIAMFKRFILTAPEGVQPAEAEALAKEIAVTKFTVVDWSGTWNLAETWGGNTYWDTDGNGEVTLYELTHNQYELGGGWFGLGLKPGETQEITIGLKMREEAGNGVQGFAANLGMEVIATQVNEDAIQDNMENSGINLSIDYVGDTDVSYFYTHFNRGPVNPQ